MGTVYLARHMLLGHEVAIKVLQREISASPVLVHRFFLEAKAVAMLRDPGLTQLHDYGHTKDGRAYFVMEYLEGETLLQRLRRGVTFSEQEVLCIAVQVARTLAIVHNHGVVHRDLKPDNIFIVSDPSVDGGERVKVLDFGVAKLNALTRGMDELTRATELLGTPLYMAPEQWQGAARVDARVDTYSLGCIMYCCLCGRPPFARGTIGEMCAAHLLEVPASLDVHRPGISPAINKLVLQCLEKEPERRPATMPAVAMRLHACMRAISVHRRGAAEPVAVQRQQAPSKAGVRRETTRIEVANATLVDPPEKDAAATVERPSVWSALAAGDNHRDEGERSNDTKTAPRKKQRATVKIPVASPPHGAASELPDATTRNRAFHALRATTVMEGSATDVLTRAFDAPPDGDGVVADTHTREVRVPTCDVAPSSVAPSSAAPSSAAPSSAAPSSVTPSVIIQHSARPPGNTGDAADAPVDTSGFGPSATPTSEVPTSEVPAEPAAVGYQATALASGPFLAIAVGDDGNRDDGVTMALGDADGARPTNTDISDEDVPTAVDGWADGGHGDDACHVPPSLRGARPGGPHDLIPHMISVRVPFSHRLRALRSEESIRRGVAGFTVSLLLMGVVSISWRATVPRSASEHHDVRKGRRSGDDIVVELRLGALERTSAEMVRGVDTSLRVERSSDGAATASDDDAEDAAPAPAKPSPPRAVRRGDKPNTKNMARRKKYLYWRARAGKANEQELHMLKGICMDDGDRNCRDLAVKRLRALTKRRR